MLGVVITSAWRRLGRLGWIFLVVDLEMHATENYHFLLDGPFLLFGYSLVAVIDWMMMGFYESWV